MPKCEQEMCPNWDGSGCPCDVLDLDRTWSHWCYDQEPERLPVSTPRCPQCGALNFA